MCNSTCACWPEHLHCRKQTKDMRNDAVKLFYSKPEVFKQNVGDYLANVGKHYAKFAGYSNGWVDGCYR